jgi:hypothetical protein
MDCSITQDNFAQLFIDTFVPDIPIKQLKRMRCYAPDHGYLWGVCDCDLVPNLKGFDAMNEYDRLEKAEAVEIVYDNGFEDNDNARPLSEDHDTANKIRDAGLMEFYVIGKDFSWCYIVTHELDACGPYLILRKSL